MNEPGRPTSPNEVAEHLRSVVLENGMPNYRETAYTLGGMSIGGIEDSTVSYNLEDSTFEVSKAGTTMPNDGTPLGSIVLNRTLTEAKNSITGTSLVADEIDSLVTNLTQELGAITNPEPAAAEVVLDEITREEDPAKYVRLRHKFPFSLEAIFAMTHLKTQEELQQAPIGHLSPHLIDEAKEVFFRNSIGSLNVYGDMIFEQKQKPAMKGLEDARHAYMELVPEALRESVAPQIEKAMRFIEVVYAAHSRMIGRDMLDIQPDVAYQVMESFIAGDLHEQVGSAFVEAPALLRGSLGDPEMDHSSGKPHPSLKSEAIDRRYVTAGASALAWKMLQAQDQVNCLEIAIQQ